MRSIVTALVVITLAGLLGGNTVQAANNDMTCNKTSNNNNGVLSGNVTCNFTTYTGSKQVLFGLKDKPKPQQLTINYQSKVTKGSITVQLVDDSGKVYYNKNLSAGNDQVTFNLNLVKTDELTLNLKGTNTSGQLSYNW